jgi:hypothetical protein
VHIWADTVLAEDGGEERAPAGAFDVTVYWIWGK